MAGLLHARGACVRHGSVTKACKGDGNQAKSVAPGVPRGRGRHPWGTSRQLARRDVTEACKGDGNRAKSVTLGMPRGKIRLPRGVPRQLARRDVTEAREGETRRWGRSPSGHFAAGGVALGQPRGSLPTGVPRECARVTEIGRKPSPSGRSAAESVTLGASRGGRPLPRSAIM